MGVKKFEPHKSSIGGIDANVMALIAYLGSAVLGFIPGIRYVAFLLPIVIYIIEKNSQFVKFHAMQSILLSVFNWAIAIVYVILVGIAAGTGNMGALGIISILAIVYYLIAIVFLVFFIIAAIKAYQYIGYKIPVVGNIAEKMVFKA